MGIPNACPHNVGSFGHIPNTRACSSTQPHQKIEDGPIQWIMSQRDYGRLSWCQADKTGCCYWGRSQLNRKCRLSCCWDGNWDRGVSQCYTPWQLHLQVHGLNMPQPYVSLPFSQLLEVFEKGAVFIVLRRVVSSLGGEKVMAYYNQDVRSLALMMGWNSSTRRVQMRTTCRNSSVNDTTKTHLKAVTKAVYLADLRPVLKAVWKIGFVVMRLAGLMAVSKTV